jgi:hypothetical protein
MNKIFTREEWLAGDIYDKTFALTWEQETGFKAKFLVLIEKSLQKKEDIFDWIIANQKKIYLYNEFLWAIQDEKDLLEFILRW